MLMGICTATFPTPSMPCLGALVDMTDTCHSGTWPRPRACVCVLLVQRFVGVWGVWVRGNGFATFAVIAVMGRRTFGLDFVRAHTGAEL